VTRRLLAVLFCAAAAACGEVRKLTLDEARELAMRQNRGLQLARLKAEEARSKQKAARTDYFPKVLADANYLYFNKRLGTNLALGELGFGILPPPLPPIAVPLTVVKQNLLLSTATVGQPLTQLLRVREGVNAAASEADAAEARTAKGEHDVAFAVEQLYCGVLVAQGQLQAALLRQQAAEQWLRDAEGAVESGTALEVARIGRRAAVLEAKHAVAAARTQLADYAEALNVVLGLPVSTELELAPPPPALLPFAAAEDAAAAALHSNPEILEAGHTVARARAGLRAARLEYVPDVTAVGQAFHLEGMPAMPGNFAALGARVSYNLFDFGKRRETVKERQLQVTQAETNLQRLKEQLEADVRKAFRAVEQASQSVEAAREALSLRQESERISRDQFELGLGVEAAYLEAKAARAAAQADLLRAEAAKRLAIAGLKRLVGGPR